MVQITHIQFLTLLYPSRVEARLIIFILGEFSRASPPLRIQTQNRALTWLS
jgi:hypothetical protein